VQTLVVPTSMLTIVLSKTILAFHPWLITGNQLEGQYDNKVFISGFGVNALLAGFLAFVGDRLGVELYYAAIVAFGVRLFNNLAIIRRHFL